jgi:alkanesulfonate monooxygenase SsuD/methylene tetrahydromethanopterin reductase-like flavin-dependent oxidoreductase (luciferase family)
MALAILARETKRARLLSLGTPIENRPDPVRVAEELAWLDVLSGGRFEMGLVKGAPYEIAPANSNPANLMRRYWEAHDLILKAMSTTDGSNQKWASHTEFTVVQAGIKGVARRSLSAWCDNPADPPRTAIRSSRSTGPHLRSHQLEWGPK